MVQEPRLRVLLVLLERNPERVRHIDRLAVVLTQENAYDALRRASGDGACMVVCY